MWVIFGRKVETERVPGGAQVEKKCDHCGEVAMFYERRAISKLQLYFLDVLEYSNRRVMACGACGTLYGTDEVGRDAEPVDAFVAQAKDAFGRLGDAAKAGFERVRVGGARALEGVREGERSGKPNASSVGREPEVTDDPLADDDAALEAKFKDLETKYRIGDD